MTSSSKLQTGLTDVLEKLLIRYCMIQILENLYFQVTMMYGPVKDEVFSLGRSCEPKSTFPEGMYFVWWHKSLVSST